MNTFSFVWKKISIVALTLLALLWLLSIYGLVKSGGVLHIASWPLFQGLEILGFILITGYAIWQWACTLFPEPLGEQFADVNRIAHQAIGWLALLVVWLGCAGFLALSVGQPQGMSKAESARLARIVMKYLLDANTSNGELVYVHAWSNKEIDDLRAMMPGVQFRDWSDPANSTNCGAPDAAPLAAPLDARPPFPDAIAACLQRTLKVQVFDADYVFWNVAEVRWSYPLCNGSVILANTPWGWHRIGTGADMCWKSPKKNSG